MVLIVNSITEFAFGISTFSHKALRSISICMTLFVLLNIVVLYTIMVVQIVRSSKTMDNSRQTKANGR